jgi:hypothetical protein
VNAHGVQHSQPDPNWDWGVFRQTSCAIYALGDDNTGGADAGTREWEADIYGMAGRTRVLLRLSLEGTSPPGRHDVMPDNVPGSSDGEAILQTANGKTEYIGSYGSWFRVNHDQASGKLYLTLGLNGQYPGAETVKGTWRCA